jgi:predicted RNA-binding Zn ribbon-like protein
VIKAGSLTHCNRTFSEAKKGRVIGGLAVLLKGAVEGDDPLELFDEAGLIRSSVFIRRKNWIDRRISRGRVARACRSQELIRETERRVVLAREGGKKSNSDVPEIEVFIRGVPKGEATAFLVEIKADRTVGLPFRDYSSGRDESGVARSKDVDWIRIGVGCNKSLSD